ncbi:MAG: aldehyde dehydrogenase [Sphingobacteriales bacterium SCN 48-20]|uniref:aldehyde dehydrogenase n=1 Tax=Terrimonas ferruginea TaxID=249 RepID=UPI00086B5A85|nr:aldehyde dehydrogenase [Terrimonas ferruginea]MBN8782100.1 aldehyde dehydrogenase [Terrimonas ferruginea]ODT91648.1 MAG: aldehyde dehydrogenase [Sphingobacteriales bacterium SCN 48-20]OJW42646.1 MAG: aldehyde dehydrogenase family protein [Sphingobacteriales bacterium 48-107]
MASIASLQQLRDYFNAGHTRSYAFRRQQLQALKKAVQTHEDALQAALYQDLHKSPEEAWVTETGFLLNEINYAIRHLREWMEPKKVGTNLLNLPSGSSIHAEPLGVVLIVAPWNYPLQLLLTPLVGAIAAGNCVVLKASEFAPATAAVIKKMIADFFDPSYILYTEGNGAEVVPAMMNNFRFDHVFYTGSTTVGKLVYKMAAEKLVPVTLELGGKSPCVIEADADLKVAARRIAMTKFSNAGQMCIAVDYVLIHESVKDKWVEEMKKALKIFFSGNPEQSHEYGRIINHRQYDRISGYLQQGKLLHGGKQNRDTLYIEPTLLTDISTGASVMEEEIFGPVLPVIGFNDKKEALDIIAKHPDPLAFYVYTSDKKKAAQWLQDVPSGNACINNSSLHATNHHLPFGGRGNSGIGAYHGHHSFNIFSHRKGVLRTPTWFDPAMKYPPFKGKLKLLKWLVG